MCNCRLLFPVLRLYADGFLNAVKLRIYGSFVIKAILREPLFPDNIITSLTCKGKVVYGQEPPRGESTTTECGFNYQLLAVITEVAQWGAPSCSQPQSATDNGVRDGRSN